MGKKRNSNVLEKHRSVASCTPPTGDLACNPGMCPDRELNQRPFGLQASSQSTEAHQPGLNILLTDLVFKSKKLSKNNHESTCQLLSISIPFLKNKKKSVVLN